MLTPNAGVLAKPGLMVQNLEGLSTLGKDGTCGSHCF